VLFNIISRRLRWLLCPLHCYRVIVISAIQDTDQDAADKVYMKIFIQKDQDEKIRSIERVQCMSDLQNKRRERKELSSYNSLLKVNKQEFSASCFKIEPASKQQMFTFQFSVKVVGLHGTKL